MPVMPVLKWFWPKYDETAKAERSVMTASGTAWIAGVIGAGMAVYRFANGQELDGTVAVLAAGFWAIAGWRIRKFSIAWATTAVVVFALNGALLIFQRGLGILVNIFVLVCFFAFLNGVRATRAHHRLRTKSARSSTEV